MYIYFSPEVFLHLSRLPGDRVLEPLSRISTSAFHTKESQNLYGERLGQLRTPGFVQRPYERNSQPDGYRLCSEWATRCAWWSALSSYVLNVSLVMFTTGHTVITSLKDRSAANSVTHWQLPHDSSADQSATIKWVTFLLNRHIHVQGHYW